MNNFEKDLVQKPDYSILNGLVKQISHSVHQTDSNLDEMISKMSKEEQKILMELSHRLKSTAAQNTKSPNSTGKNFNFNDTVVRLQQHSQIPSSSHITSNRANDKIEITTSTLQDELSKANARGDGGDTTEDDDVCSRTSEVSRMLQHQPIMSKISTIKSTEGNGESFAGKNVEILSDRQQQSCGSQFTKLKEVNDKINANNKQPTDRSQHTLQNCIKSEGDTFHKQIEQQQKQFQTKIFDYKNSQENIQKKVQKSLIHKQLNAQLIESHSELELIDARNDISGTQSQLSLIYDSQLQSKPTVDNRQQLISKTSTFNNNQAAAVTSYGSLQNTANEISKVFSMYEDHLKESSEQPYRKQMVYKYNHAPQQQQIMAQNVKEAPRNYQVANRGMKQEINNNYYGAHEQQPRQQSPIGIYKQPSQIHKDEKFDTLVAGRALNYQIKENRETTYEIVKPSMKQEEEKSNKFEYKSTFAKKFFQCSQNNDIHVTHQRAQYENVEKRQLIQINDLEMKPQSPIESYQPPQPPQVTAQNTNQVTAQNTNLGTAENTNHKKYDENYYDQRLQKLMPQVSQQELEYYSKKAKHVQIVEDLPSHSSSQPTQPRGLKETLSSSSEYASVFPYPQIKQNQQLTDLRNYKDLFNHQQQNADGFSFRRQQQEIAPENNWKDQIHQSKSVPDYKNIHPGTDFQNHNWMNPQLSYQETGGKIVPQRTLDPILFNGGSGCDTTTQYTPIDGDTFSEHHKLSTFQNSQANNSQQKLVSHYGSYNQQYHAPSIGNIPLPVSLPAGQTSIAQNVIQRNAEQQKVKEFHEKQQRDLDLYKQENKERILYIQDHHRNLENIMKNKQDPYQQEAMDKKGETSLQNVDQISKNRNGVVHIDPNDKSVKIAPWEIKPDTTTYSNGIKSPSSIQGTTSLSQTGQLSNLTDIKGTSQKEQADDYQSSNALTSALYIAELKKQEQDIQDKLNFLKQRLPPNEAKYSRKSPLQSENSVLNEEIKPVKESAFNSRNHSKKQNDISMENIAQPNISIRKSIEITSPLTDHSDGLYTNHESSSLYNQIKGRVILQKKQSNMKLPTSVHGAQNKSMYEQMKTEIEDQEKEQLNTERTRSEQFNNYKEQLQSQFNQQIKSQQAKRLIKAVSSGLKYTNNGPVTSKSAINKENRQQNNQKPPIKKQLKQQKNHQQKNQFVQKVNNHKQTQKQQKCQNGMCIHRHQSHQNSFQNGCSDSQTIYSTIKNSSRSRLKQASQQQQTSIITHLDQPNKNHFSSVNSGNTISASPRSQYGGASYLQNLPGPSNHHQEQIISLNNKRPSSCQHQISVIDEVPQQQQNSNQLRKKKQLQRNYSSYKIDPFMIQKATIPQMPQRSVSGDRTKKAKSQGSYNSRRRRVSSGKSRKRVQAMDLIRKAEDMISGKNSNNDSFNEVRLGNKSPESVNLSMFQAKFSNSKYNQGSKLKELNNNFSFYSDKSDYYQNKQKKNIRSSNKRKHKSILRSKQSQYSNNSNLSKISNVSQNSKNARFEEISSLSKNSGAALSKNQKRQMSILKNHKSQIPSPCMSLQNYNMYAKQERRVQFPKVRIPQNYMKQEGPRQYKSSRAGGKHEELSQQEIRSQIARSSISSYNREYFNKKSVLYSQINSSNPNSQRGGLEQPRIVTNQKKSSDRNKKLKFELQDIPPVVSGVKNQMKSLNLEKIEEQKVKDKKQVQKSSTGRSNSKNKDKFQQNLMNKMNDLMQFLITSPDEKNEYVITISKKSKR